jgi:hypothetical protein
MLVVHGVALKMKIASDRARLRQVLTVRSHDLYIAQAELMLNAAMGMALMREIQHAIDEEVRCGRMAPAKQWNELKNDLNGAVAATRRMLADSERQWAEALSDTMTDRPRDADVALDRYAPLMQQLAVEERERERLARARSRAREALAKLPSRTELLVAALAVTTAIWLGFVKLPDHFATGLPALTVEDFPRNDGFLEVVARPPSLYATIDGDIWHGLDQDSRRHLVRTVSSVLLTFGYSGVHLKTEDGRPVAQWLLQNGVTLIEKDETRLPPQPAVATSEPAER